MKKQTNTTTPAISSNGVLPAVFDISDYLISKGFKKLFWDDLSGENQGRCEYHYCRFGHDNWNGAIVIWREDDNQMAIGNSDDVEIPESEADFFEQIKLSRQHELLTILNGR